MFKKLFKPEPDPFMNRIMSEIAARLMGVRWIAWLTPDGLARASFPEDLELDRPSAMGAAMQSLSERISAELRGGMLHYSLIAGENGLNLLLVLDADNALLFNLHPQTSIDALLAEVRRTIQTYALHLKLAPDSWWLSSA